MKRECQRQLTVVPEATIRWNGAEERNELMKRISNAAPEPPKIPLHRSQGASEPGW